MALALVATAIGLLGIIGWLADVPLAASWLPTLAPVRPNAALLSAALGVALLLAGRPGRVRFAGQAIALAAFALAAATAAEWFMGRDVGVDHLFWPPSLEGPAESASDRMAVVATLAYLSLSVAIFARSGGRPLAWLVEPAAMVTGFLALFAVVSILLGADLDLAVGGSRVSLPGATAAALLVVAVIASRPGHRTVRTLVDTGPVGRATRRILPAVAAFPVAGWLLFNAYRAGLVAAAASVAIGVILGMAYSAFLLSRAARNVNELDQDAAAAREVRDKFFDLTADLVAMAGADTRLRYVSPSWLTVLGLNPAELLGRSYFELIHPDDRARSEAAFAEEVTKRRGRHEFESRFRHRDGSWRWIEWATHPDPDSGGVYAVGRDVTELRRQREERELLAAVVEQADDAIVIFDAAARIAYVNPAFKQLGPPAEEVIATLGLDFARGTDARVARRSIISAMRGGERWAGETTTTLPDGSEVLLDTSLTPVHDAGGRIINWVGVARDVTAHRATQAALDREVTERAVVVAALGRLDLSGDLDDVAGRMCEELLVLPGVDYAAILGFGTSQAQIVAARGLDGPALTAGVILPIDVTQSLRARAEHGPWTFVLDRNVRRAAYDPLIAAGLRVLACAPIRNGTGVVGMIRIGTSREDQHDQLIRLLPAISEFASAASGVIGPAIEARTADELMRSTVRRWIDGRAFSVVFQPIVEMASGATLGYEALTRLTDATRADHAFAEARAVGLGLELELATIAEALRASAELPAGRWLDLNVSPALLLHGRFLADALAGRDRPIVLEVTEHERIDDYGAIRDAVRRLGPDIRLAVDDAGAGAANFVHMVELRPDFVKLDVGLVRGINLDPTRQALVVGLRHFARTAGCLLVAEGIETAAEADTLRSFGIEFGQGYWLGRPAPARAFGAAPDASPVALSTAGMRAVAPRRPDAERRPASQRSDSAIWIAASRPRPVSSRKVIPSPVQTRVSPTVR
jgi:PAS domain S-box-containing protein